MRILKYLVIILGDLVRSWAVLGPFGAVSGRSGEGSSESSWDRKWQKASGKRVFWASWRYLGQSWRYLADLEAAWDNFG